MTEKPQVELPDLVCLDDERRPYWKRVLFFALALVCVVLGVVLWLTPVLTGVPLYLLAVVFFAKASRPLGMWINLQDRKLPHGVRIALRPRLWRSRSRA